MKKPFKYILVADGVKYYLQAFVDSNLEKIGEVEER